MHSNIRISGPAGLGINSLAEIIGHMFAALGYHTVSDIEYESRIKGGTNWFDINVSDTGSSIRKTVDILIPFDVAAVEKSVSHIRTGGAIIINSKHTEKFSDTVRAAIAEKNIELISFPIDHKYENTSLLGAFVHIAGIPSEYAIREIEASFAAKPEAAAESIAQLQSAMAMNLSSASIPQFPSTGAPKPIFFHGNKMIAEGAIATGLEYYSAYPMTPATTILTEIVASGKVPYLQAEDEISVINSALGASFTGARAMVGSSGGGFALMTEALSFAAQAELPIVAALVQRAGPSTGTPTYQEQGDIAYAIRPSFGEFGHVVLYPSTSEEAYRFGGLALNIAQKYQTIVILLSDKQFAENFVAIPALPEAPAIERGKILENPPADYKRYEFTEDGVSPYVRVGTEQGEFIATSYEHDEYGASSEDFANKIAMTEKRAKKLEGFFEKEGILGYAHINPSAKKCIVTVSFTRYVAEDFVREHPEYSLLVITSILPLDPRIRPILEGMDEIVFVESNHTGQLEHHVTSTLALSDATRSRVRHFRKYDLLPFYREDFDTYFGI